MCSNVPCTTPLPRLARKGYFSSLSSTLNVFHQAEGSCLFHSVRTTPGPYNKDELLFEVGSPRVEEQVCPPSECLLSGGAPSDLDDGSCSPGKVDMSRTGISSGGWSPGCCLRVCTVIWELTAKARTTFSSFGTIHTRQHCGVQS